MLVQDIFGFPDQEDSQCDRCAPWVEPMVGAVHVGGYSLRPQFFSPNSRGLKMIPDLHYCDGCGADFLSDVNLLMHRTMCDMHPPGDEIYRDDHHRLAVYECRGADELCGPTCQRFCLLSKHFLDHKETFLDVESFIFYLLFHFDDDGFHYMGYFSRDRQPQCLCNVACIAVLPQYQKLGVGTLLIELSYELTRRQGRTGTPERPITEAGRRAYSAYWCRLISRQLVASAAAGESVSTSALSRATGMLPSDVLATVVELGALRSHRGRNVLVVTDSVRKWAMTTPRISIDFDALHC